MMNDLTSLAIAGALAVGAFFGTYLYGKHSVQTKWDEANIKTEERIKLLTEQANKITTVIETKYVDRVKVIKEKGETIVQYIPQYITQNDNANCTINSGFVRVFNAAAEDRIPGAPVETDGAASGITLAEVAATTATNFTTCHVYKARAEELMSWINEQRDLNK